MSTQEAEVVSPPEGEHPYYVLLRQWQDVSQAVKELTQQERALREQLFAGTFPSPEEGVNKYELPDGRVVKGTYKLTRKLDVEKLEAAVNDTSVSAEVAQKVVRIKYELDLKAFKDLPDIARNALEVQQIVTTAPALPTLEIVNPKE